MKEELNEKDYPPEYYQELPPEVSSSYMARADEIRENAKASYAYYLQDENYRMLMELHEKLSPARRKEVHYDAVMGYVYGLKLAIKQDDLVVMRRHENPMRYLQSFEDCRKRIEGLEPVKEEVEQMMFHL